MLECEWKHLLTSLRTGRKAGILFSTVSNMIGVQKPGKHHLRQKIEGDNTVGRGCINFFVMCPVFGCTEKGETASLEDSYSKCTISLCHEKTSHTPTSRDILQKT